LHLQNNFKVSLKGKAQSKDWAFFVCKNLGNTHFFNLFPDKRAFALSSVITFLPVLASSSFIATFATLPP